MTKTAIRSLLQVSNVARVDGKIAPGDIVDVALCRALVAKGECTTAELIRACNVNRNTVNEHLKGLEKRGLVAKVKRGLWKITDKGRDWMSSECRPNVAF